MSTLTKKHGLHGFVLLMLLQPVTVVNDISDQSVFANKEAMFECEIKINYPEITLSWYKGTQKLDTSDKYEISIRGDRHLLKIKKCQLSDQGNYRVVCGPHISSAKLTVMGQYWSCFNGFIQHHDSRMTCIVASRAESTRAPQEQTRTFEWFNKNINNVNRLLFRISASISSRFSKKDGFKSLRVNQQGFL